MIEVAHKEYSKDPNEFEKLLIDAEKPLKQFANATECPECGQSRWKNVKDRNEERKQIPSKVIWYFPPIPRFKRLFKSIECAENLIWHASERIEDGTLLDIPGKSKDVLNAKRDLVDLKLRPELALISNPNGLGTRKSQDYLDTSNIGRPLSIRVPFKPEQELLHQAHRYVLENTIDVSTELEVGNTEVLDNLRWIAHGPHPFVITYSGYAINERRYYAKSSEKDRSVQNSGVSLVAKTMQVSSSKDKNSIIGDMSFYGVIQEIWELNYNTFNVSMFKCDWVQNSGGFRINELGYILVDLNRVGHKLDSFILASQAKQVLYVEDPSDVRWSVVLTPPQRDFKNRYNDNELGDKILRYEGIFNDMPDVDLNNDLDDNISTLGDKKVVRYNEDGAPIGENGAKLKSFIRSATYYHVPITYTSWKSVPTELKDKIFTTVEAAFIIDPRSRKNVLQTAGISFRQFKNWLTTKFIIPHKDEPQLLQVPPEKNSFIEQNHWEEFVRSRLSKTFQDEISMNIDSSSVNRHYSNDVLTQALGTKKHNGRVRGVDTRVSELKAQIRSNLSTPMSAHGSCSRPIMLEGIEEKGKRIEVESMDKPKENEKKGKEVMKMNEPEFDVLKSILRYAEKVMEKDSSITFSLPADIFGISQKSSVLGEDIIDLCNMNEVKTFTLVTYMMGHWALLAINAYEDIVFYLDSLRTTSKATTRYVTDTGIAINHSQKNINKSRKQSLWRICPLQVGSTACGYVMKYMREIVNRGSIVISNLIDTRKPYSQTELDEVRVKLAEFLGSYI
ncbi:putative serine/threonine-protein kinase nek2 [Cucumis melo var. makuwa]|uniref:Serine/threonine-protein kinase nek2 n=1 Tax=Cucumis melo var. makuwa TaxID=1194695 RepID=A0A5A7VET0_CUCMM|nr:putative serine/threonine-protein kinase nek2 [Cucumis melo var. makuwa]TYK26190.1 putative serine/threonine-protein kinase nek2 [Cucumis melo var. makuwa]